MPKGLKLRGSEFCCCDAWNGGESVDGRLRKGFVEGDAGAGAEGACERKGLLPVDCAEAGDG